MNVEMPVATELRIEHGLVKCDWLCARLKDISAVYTSTETKEATCRTSRWPFTNRFKVTTVSKYAVVMQCGRRDFWLYVPNKEEQKDLYSRLYSAMQTS